jgi:glycosyltransferase involved in cell wall biosynthesis
VLFLGTLEPRKNVAGLLDAFERVLAHGDRARTCCAGLDRARHGAPELVLAGHAPEDAGPCLERLERPPLQGHVRHIGYVDPDRRRALYEGARLLVQPSFEEGFGFPVLEAMTIGVPVVAADRGALPEVLGDTGLLVNPDDPDQIAAAIDRLLDDDALATSCASRGLVRAMQFDWRHTARLVYEAYQLAIGRRPCASA